VQRLTLGIIREFGDGLYYTKAKTKRQKGKEGNTNEDSPNRFLGLGALTLEA
jgi:hypothetical protein